MVKPTRGKSGPIKRVPTEYRLKKSTRDEFLAMRAIEEARKSGTLVEPAEINPYIPYFIARTPWYSGTATEDGKPNLKHQRLPAQQCASSITAPVAKKLFLGKASKYRDGACENCGAATHKTKECLEKPRAIGARWSGRDFASDEITQVLGTESQMGFEAKRDRWSNYDPDDYKEQVIEKHLPEGEETDSDDLYADTADMPGQHVDKDTRITVRNLRIREDTAKYLFNLDTDSAYYDPKTRSMKEAPIAPSVEDQDEKDHFLGDMAWKKSGDATEVPKMQIFAWQAAEKGLSNASMQATPTAASIQYKMHIKKVAEKNKARLSALEAKYGPMQETAPEPPTGS
jgi:pre-mRNA-processing factor SLU7